MSIRASLSGHDVRPEISVPPLEPDVVPSEGHELRACKGVPSRPSRTHKMLMEEGWLA